MAAASLAGAGGGIKKTRVDQVAQKWRGVHIRRATPELTRGNHKTKVNSTNSQGN